ncbi:MAG: chalcone and stilbene synthase domain protein, partial [Verrucomicrobiales bacterium]|nr:chalcone and stilbene synthase domain protein [Verrucomicrobiales bacterium]
PHWVTPDSSLQKVRLIAQNAAIQTRHTVLENPLGPPGSGAFYPFGNFPSTRERMVVYRREAPLLARRAAEALLEKTGSLTGVTHLIVTTCTGFFAPGIDIDLIQHLSLSPTIKRTVIGFMGCYAALTGLRQAREIILAQPDAQVLMVNVELCSLHLQETDLLDRLVSFCLFADGAAASLITAQPAGLRLDNSFTALSLADADRMSWMVEDQGFAMTLDARVPVKIKQFLAKNPHLIGRCAAPGADDLWAIHPGGRMILDALQDHFSLTEAQMEPSRSVLRDYGNMSSATIMFALRRLLESPLPDSHPRPGHALAFGPGLTVEGLDFTHLGTTPG